MGKEIYTKHIQTEVTSFLGIRLPHIPSLAMQHQKVMHQSPHQYCNQQSNHLNVSRHISNKARVGWGEEIHMSIELGTA